LVENRPASVTLGRGFWTVTALLALLSLVGIYYWTTAPIERVMPIVGAEPGEQVDLLLRFMSASGTALFLFVGGYLIYFSLAFRAKASDSPDAVGVQIHDNHTLEFWWTAIPTLYVILLSILSIYIWRQIQVVQAPNPLVVQSLGHQWYFTFRYPQINGEVTGEMHLPVNQPVVLNVTSSDVIHSFWVPAFRLKADMIPGLINTIRFTPTVIGRYPIICTEFCGTDHGLMNATVPGEGGKPNPGAEFVVVDSPANFQKWYHKTQLANAHESNALPSTTGTIALTGGDANAGKALFAQKCTACHALGPFSQRIVGPGLRDVLHDPNHRTLVDGDPATPANVARILQQGFTGSYGTMPNATANGLSDKDIADLVAYLDSLK
jgi:cytochrome c oxidase subunit II